MNSLTAGPWPIVHLASEERDRAQRLALAEAKASPDPHRIVAADSLVARIQKAFRFQREPSCVDCGAAA
jgi:hypothetical protein